MLKFLMPEDKINVTNLEGNYSVNKLKKFDRDNLIKNRNNISNLIVCLNNNEYSFIRLSTAHPNRNYSYYYGTRPYSTVAELEQDVKTLKELVNTNLAKNTLGLNEEVEIIGKFEELESLSKYPHRYFSSMLSSTAIYKVLGEDENQLIFRYVNKQKKTNGKFENYSYVLKFLDRDLDIMEGIFTRRVSIVMAQALITGRNLVDEGKDLYRFFKLPKKDSSKMRNIYEPCPELKEVMRDLNKVLQKAFESKLKTNQYAYIKGRNIKHNALVHKDAQTIVKTDISSFFESTKYSFVEPYLEFLCRDELLLAEFKKYITNPETDGLYMGNPISGTLTNLMMHKVVLYLQNILKKRNMNISVYADDITISSNERISKEMVINVVKFVLDEYGLDFELKKEKTSKLSKQNRHICGVTINHNDTLTVRREYYEKSRVMLYKLSKGEEINIPLNKFKGRLNFYKYIDDSGKFDRLFTKYQTTLEEIGFKI